MESIWNEGIDIPQFDKLCGEIKTDVLVIGGGITGMLCAYMLKMAGVDTVVVESNRICSHTTKNTTAKITFQHGLIYDKMIKRFGVETAKLYLEAQSEAIGQYKKISKDIDCDFFECSSFVYSMSDRKKIEKETEALLKLGCDAELIDILPLPFSVSGAVCVKNQAQFHPLKFLYQLSKELTIFENTKVTEILPDGALTNRGKISAEKIIVATHFPFLNKHGAYFLKMYQHRSYVLALKNIPTLNDMYVDESKEGFSFRSYNGLMLIGGGSHRTGKKGGGWQEISEFAKLNYPGAKEVARWATQDCMTLDDIPYIGQYSKNTPSLYVATGFNKWGMTSAMVSGMILRDLVCGKENKYASVFSPSRSILRPQLALNAFESVVNLLTPTSPRCMHMGCALKYNAEEHSWDCPCHGSRFTKEGELIDNPSTDNLGHK